MSDRPEAEGGYSVRPTTGHLLPQWDEAGTARESFAQKAYGEIYVPYPPQTAIMQRIEALRSSSLGRRGQPLPGLRLSEVSQAGKSATLQRYIFDLHEKSRTDGDYNPNRVIYVGLKRRITCKMLYQHILKTLGDPNADRGNLEILSQRMEEFLPRLGVELLIVDEVQHLANNRADSSQVTDELKSFLDAGLVPVVFAGNDESLRFFEENNQLSARLGIPLELSPVSVKSKSQTSAFKTFVAKLDRAVHAACGMRQLSRFDDAGIVKGLYLASGGHIGRVCRIVGAALSFASRRDADCIEVYDLSLAVRGLAVPSKWTQDNPFDKDR